MKEAIFNLILMLIAPVMKMLAAKIPDKVLAVMDDVNPIIDEVQKELKAEADKRDIDKNKKK
jgi:hypothetical protein